MKSSRKAVLAAAALVVVLGLAGCGSGPGSPASQGGKPILKFAVVAEETGAFAAYGTQLVAGVKAATKDLNASGDYAFTLVPTYYDCQSDQAICVQKTRQATSADAMPAVIGPVLSLDIIPSLEVTQKAKIPHLLMAVLPQATDNYTNSFRFSTQNDRSNQTVIDYVKANLKQGQTVAIVNANNDFGKGGAEIQAKQLAKIGITPVATIGHDPSQADYTPMIVKLKQLNPRYVLLSDSNPADIAKLLRQSKDLGLASQWIGADASGTIQLAGDAADGYMTVSPWFPNNSADPNSVKLTKELSAQGVKDPGWIAAMGYDATMGLASAARAKGLTSADLMNGLSHLTDMPGLAAKSWTFTAKDRAGLTTSTIANWTGTAYTTVWPVTAK